PHLYYPPASPPERTPYPSSSSSRPPPQPHESTCSASPAHKPSEIPQAHHTQTAPCPDATPAPRPNNPHAPKSHAAHSPAIPARADASPQRTDALPARGAAHNPYRAAVPRSHTHPQTPQPRFHSIP